jgi:predicted transposase YbfD/YdcC
VLEALIKELASIEDPRCEWKVEHRLLDLLVIAVCAVLGEAESFEDIALYGRCKREWLGGFLALPNGIPSHDTFRRVLMLVDPDAFERSFLGWVRAVFRPEGDGPRQVAIDGKAVRRSFDRRKGRSPLHLVSAYATEGGIVLAQRATDAKGGELAVLPDLLDGLDLAGCLVSLDALACQPAIAERIVGRGGDYLLALKGNRGKAHAEVRDWFAANAFAPGAPPRPCFDAFDESHGRLVRRRVFACTDLSVFGTLADWPGLATVVAVETIRGIPGRGKVTAEIRHYLSSARLPAERLAGAIRNHWRAENGLHWVLDVGFGEDASRIRDRNAARNLALLRRIALNLVRADTTLNASLKGKRKYAGWDDAFMAALIAGWSRASPLGLTHVISYLKAALA